MGDARITHTLYFCLDAVTYGYGQPNANKAFTFLTNKKLSVSIDKEKEQSNTTIYPNPSSSQAFLSIKNIRPSSTVHIEIFDQTGSRRLWEKSYPFRHGNMQGVPLPEMNETGQFLVRVSDEKGGSLGGMVWVKN